MQQFCLHEHACMYVVMYILLGLLCALLYACGSGGQRSTLDVFPLNAL